VVLVVTANDRVSRVAHEIHGDDPRHLYQRRPDDDGQHHDIFAEAHHLFGQTHHLV